MQHEKNTGEKLTEQNNRKISHFWKEKKKVGGGKKYFKQESRSGSAIEKDRYELIRSENGLLKKE